MKSIRISLWLPVLIGLSLALMACGSSDSSSSSSSDPVPQYGPDLSLSLPDSLTGGKVAPLGMSSKFTPMSMRPMAAGGDPCNFHGHGSGDPFENGHKMTKFLVGAVASWTCITNQFIRFIDLLVFLGIDKDGTPLDLVDPSHKAGDATWLSVDEVSPDVTVVKLYWTADQVLPIAGDEGFYLRWDTTGGDLTGKMVVDVADIANDPGDPYDPDEDPAYLRLDFTRDAFQKTGDLYLGFSATHPWVKSSGWRINVVKRLDGAYPKYTAMGVIDMTAQWDTRYNGPPDFFSEFPQLKSFAVASSSGQGAAEARMANLGLVLFPVDTDNDHLGTFLFTKDDRYYFGGGSPVVFKDVTAATYKGYHDIGAGGDIADALAVDAIIDFTMASKGDPVPYAGTEYVGCTTGTDADCITFLNALFSGGDFGSEANVGTQPAVGDQRRDALDGADATYYADACPDDGTPGCTWDEIVDTGVFEMVP